MSGSRLEDVWATRDYPVLVEVTRRVDAGDRPRIEDVGIATGLSSADVSRAASALERRGYVRTVGTLQTGPIQFMDVAGTAYTVTGLHPDSDDALTALVETLRQAAETTADPDELGRLNRAAGAVGDLAGTIGAGVMTAYLTHFLPH